MAPRGAARRGPGAAWPPGRRPLTRDADGLRGVSIDVEPVRGLALLVVHAAATWAMTGLIWFVQVVHYPLFSAVGADSFSRYHGAHTARTTLVVAPVMLVEALSALWIASDRPGPAAWAGLALLGVVWLATFGLSVPRHDVLSGGFDASAAQGLVATNWVRTAAWTARAGVAAWLILHRPA